MPRSRKKSFAKQNLSSRWNNALDVTNHHEPLMDPERNSIRVNLTRNPNLVNPYITDEAFEAHDFTGTDPNITDNNTVNVENEVSTSIPTTSFYGSTPAMPRILPNIPDDSSDDYDNNRSLSPI